MLCFLLLGLRLPFPAALPLTAAAAILGSAAWAMARDRPLASAAAVACAGVLVLGLVLPLAIPPPVPPDAWQAAAGRAVFTASENPGLLTFLAGRPVHRVHGVAATQAALDGGGVLILGEDEEDGLSPELRRRLGTVSSWRRLRGRLSPRSVVDAWRLGSLDALCETARMCRG
jgi:hypothetical protein